MLPEDLLEEKTEPDMSSATISSAAHDSTTAALAAQVPKETNGDVKESTISSVSPDSTTAALAAGVSGEARTPSLKNVPGGFPQTSAIETPSLHEDAEQVPSSEPAPKHGDSAEDLGGGVRLDLDSSPEANVPLEAPAAPEVVEQKEEVGEELKGVPAAQLGTGGDVTDQAQADIAVVAATVTPTIGGIAAAAGLSSASGERSEETTPAIAPNLVKQSQEAAHVSPEASTVESAVEAKKEFESELKREVSPASPVRELAENPAAPAVSPVSEPTKPVGQAPEAVEDSLAMASSKPEATSVNDAVEAKTAVESQLKDEVKPVAPIQLNTTDNAATSTAPVPKLEVTDPQEATTPLSPTTPVEPTKNGTPKNGTPRKSVENGNGEPPASPTQLTKKKNRFSFLGNLKEKLHFGKDKGKSKGEMSP